MRATVFVAEATPDLAADTAPTTAFVAGAMTQPIASARPKNQSVRASSGVGLPEHGQGQHNREAGEARCDDTRNAQPLTALLDEPAPIIRPSAIGLMIAPASIAL